jgi:hypothetical protein
MDEKRIILGDVTDFCGEVGFRREFLHFCEGSYEPPLNTSFPIGGYFESMDVFLDAPSQPTRFFTIDPKGCVFRIIRTGITVLMRTRIRRYPDVDTEACEHDAQHVNGVPKVYINSRDVQQIPATSITVQYNA